MKPEEYLAEKQYYSIGEVARMFKLTVSNIRFWENQFEMLRPKKNKKGDRFFTRQDLKNLKLIYHLVKEQGYTIDGARKKMTQHLDETSDRVELIETLKGVRTFLTTMKDQLDTRMKPTGVVERDSAELPAVENAGEVPAEEDQRDLPTD